MAGLATNSPTQLHEGVENTLTHLSLTDQKPDSFSLEKPVTVPKHRI